MDALNAHAVKSPTFPFPRYRGDVDVPAKTEEGVPGVSAERAGRHSPGQLHAAGQVGRVSENVDLFYGRPSLEVDSHGL